MGPSVVLLLVVVVLLLLVLSDVLGSVETERLGTYELCSDSDCSTSVPIVISDNMEGRMSSSGIWSSWFMSILILRSINP